MAVTVPCQSCGKNRRVPDSQSGEFICRDCQVQRLRTATGIKRFGSVVTDDQFNVVLSKVRQGNLNLEQVKLFTQVAPHFIQFQKDTIEGLKSIAIRAQASQQSAFEALQTIGDLTKTSQALTVLAQNAQSDEARVEIARCTLEIARLQTQVAVVAQSMNKENNAFWKWLGGAALGLALGVPALPRPF